MDWKALPVNEVRDRVFAALGKNRSYWRDVVLGLPGSYLDRQVFPPLPELERFPLLNTFMSNPNHIGCHTLGSSEPAFQGTHELEREVIQICAEGLLEAAPESVDGYIASGGTESNIQALWTFRNALRSKGVGREQIGILCSSDTHYSIPKSADILDLSLWQVPVDEETRRMRPAEVRRVARAAQAVGVRWLLVVLNMGTTMFGSVDAPDDVLPLLDELGLSYMAHVDAAFGGFLYPLMTEECCLNFKDKRLSSFTLDAHKMLQAPYGTGIHLIRKGLIGHVLSESAAYVPGLDCTLVGSRSGTNAVAVWMILRTYGRAGGEAFCRELVERTDRLCEGLDALGVRYYRHPGVNVVALRANEISGALAERYMLVPDCHHDTPSWQKIVVMDHVTEAQLSYFLAELRKERSERNG